MRTLYTRSLAVPGLLAFLGLGLTSSGCTKRANDCTWNANCEAATGGSSGSGGASDGGDGGNSPAGGTAAGGKSSATTVPTCNGSPDDPLCNSIDYAVFVSPTGDDTAGQGGPVSPFATLGKALSVVSAPDKPKRAVYVCASAGDYELTETLVIGAEFEGINIYGGFDCSNPKAWKYPATGARSNFVSSAPLAVKLDNLTASGKGLRLSRLRFEAATAKKPGESSIALLAVDSPNVTLTDLELVAGSGADGADGAFETIAAEKGTVGNSGTDACTVASIAGLPIPGGQPVESKCSGTTAASVGGRGGSGALGQTAQGGPGENGQFEPASNPTLFGYGGDGEKGSASLCKSGNPGARGSNGAPTAPATSPGTLGPAGFTPTDGQPGSAGLPGQGGGGGGGAKSNATTACATITAGAGQFLGASGGSGGSGGCGGKGGGNGKGGGASIALALVNSALTYEKCQLTARSGGKGGKGGAGQTGGTGGLQGTGAAGYVSGSASCAGGPGGNGGNGSAGGGGVGGPSVAVAYVSGAPKGTDNTTLMATDGAPGGMDGNGGTDAAGATGITIAVKDFGG